MYISSVNIRNLRSFAQTELRFQHPHSPQANGTAAPQNVTLLIGDNGSGKTTILKAVAIAILSPVMPDSGFRPYYLVRRSLGESSFKNQARISAEVVLHGQDFVLEAERFSDHRQTTRAHASINLQGNTEQLRYRHVKGNIGVEPLFEQDLPAYFMVGYGATRRTEKAEHLDRQSEKSRGLRYQRVAGLFEDYISLRPLAATQLHSRHKDVYRLIDKLLPDDLRFAREFEQLEPVFVQRGVHLPFPALSDGYRAYIGLISDLLYHLAYACPPNRKIEDMTGIVLIDDIDLHLHPSWQRTVVSKLATTLPRLQFIVTSHSPLVAGNLYAENIRVVSSEPSGPSIVEQYEEPIHGLNADQVLTSSYFNLTSTRSPDAVKKLAGLAEQSASRSNPDAAVQFLKQLAGKKTADKEHE